MFGTVLLIIMGLLVFLGGIAFVFNTISPWEENLNSVPGRIISFFIGTSLFGMSIAILLDAFEVTAYISIRDTLMELPSICLYGIYLYMFIDQLREIFTGKASSLDILGVIGIILTFVVILVLNFF